MGVERVSSGSTRASIGQARGEARARVWLQKGGSEMTLLLIKLLMPFFGRLTVLVIRRKRR